MQPTLKKTLLVAAASIIILGSAALWLLQDDTPKFYTVTVVHEYPHDPSAFTQGLAFEDGVLFEGTGIQGKSYIRKVDLETGQAILQTNLSAEYFGEGVTIHDGKVYQLTWRARKGIIYTRDTLKPTGTFNIEGQGWGLTDDGDRLIMSNGTATLTFLDPETLQVTGQLTVFDRGDPVPRLNELEYIDGEVWANIWFEDFIARIDPETGRVLGYIDLRGLSDGLEGEIDVLNGIAYDELNDRIIVTGKLWPKLFEIEVTQK